MTVTLWKGWRVLSPKDFVPIFREREWIKILRGEDLILIPFPFDFKDLPELSVYEDGEWEFQGVVKTALREHPSFKLVPVEVVVFRRRS
ncbi:MAG: hypothetical protein DRO36_05225 [Candidatus Hecatellales archaeon]|nr:MAG: hypothetical protein DRO36_05225 [Candidatus Hecatellales archaeon]